MMQNFVNQLREENKNGESSEDDMEADIGDEKQSSSRNNQKVPGLNLAAIKQNSQTKSISSQ